MADLIPPHGGLKEPVNCNVPAGEAAEFRARVGSLPRVTVSEATFRPCTGWATAASAR